MDARPSDHPAGKGQRRQQMHARRIIARRPVSEADIARLALRRFLHQPSDVGDNRIRPGGGHHDPDRPVDIERSGLHQVARTHAHRRAFPGQEGDVDATVTLHHAPVGGQPLARGNQHDHARPQRARRDPTALPAIVQQHRARRGLFEQRGNASARAAPHQAVEAAPGEQEEEQHHRPVEPGIFAADQRFIDTHARRQQHADADRHVHIGPPLSHRCPGRTEEGPPRIGYGGQRDQRRQPVEHLPRAALRPGPDRHGQQHDVHRGKARHRQRADQHAVFRRRHIDAGIGERLRFETQRGDGGAQVGRAERGIMLDGDALRREIDPRRRDAGGAGQAILDLADTARAMHPRHREQADLRRIYVRFGVRCGRDQGLAGHQSISWMK